MDWKRFIFSVADESFVSTLLNSAYFPPPTPAPAAPPRHQHTASCCRCCSAWQTHGLVLSRLSALHSGPLVPPSPSPSGSPPVGGEPGRGGSLRASAPQPFMCSAGHPRCVHSPGTPCVCLCVFLCLCVCVCVCA